MYVFGCRPLRWLSHYQGIRLSLKLDVLGSVHRNIKLKERTNQMQPFSRLYQGKGDLCVGLTTLSPSCVDCLEIWEPQTLGTLRTCPGL